MRDDPANLIAAARAHGVALRISGDRLLAVPVERLPADLRARLRERRPEILSRLRAEREAASIVAEVERAGWRVYERGGNVFAWSPRPFDADPFRALAARARACKPALLTVLRADAAREAADERAAIHEFDGGLDRAEAERRAAADGSNRGNETTMETPS